MDIVVKVARVSQVLGRPGQKLWYWQGFHGVSNAPGRPGKQQGYGHGCQGCHGVSQAPGGLRMHY